VTDINSLIRPTLKRITPYSPGKDSKEACRELGITEMTKLASNENPLGPSPKAVAAIQEAASGVNIYPDIPCADLTAALAEKFNTVPEGVLIGRGSGEVIHMLGLAFVNPGDEVVYSQYPFALYPGLANVLDGVAIEVPGRGFWHDLDAMADAITPRTKLVIIGNPCNPTGTICTADEVAAFMARVPDTAIVVFDEAYAEYSDAPCFGEGLPYVREGRRAIVLRTFSKIYALAGMRIGYGMTTPEIGAILKLVREPFNIGLLSQVAALASLGDPDQVARSQKLARDGKSYLYAQFDALGLEYVPTQANFMLVNVGIESRECFNKLMCQGVTVRTGDIFGLPTWIRVTIGTRAENERFIAALAATLEGAA
jgi:histidinol-phosphate aminotransferase